MGDAHANGHGPEDVRAEEKGELVGDAVEEAKGEIDEVKSGRFVPQRRIGATADEPAVEAQKHAQEQELVEEEDEIADGALPEEGWGESSSALQECSANGRACSSGSENVRSKRRNCSQ